MTEYLLTTHVVLWYTKYVGHTGGALLAVQFFSGQKKKPQGTGAGGVDRGKKMKQPLIEEPLTFVRSRATSVNS